MRLLSLGVKTRGDYARIDAEFEHDGRVVKKPIWLYGVSQTERDHQAAVIWGVTRAVKEGVRDMAFAATGDQRAWDKQDQTELASEIVNKLNEALCA